MLVISTEATYRTALCGTVSHSKSECHPTILWETGSATVVHPRGLLWHWYAQIMSRQFSIWTMCCKTKPSVHHSSRPLVCCVGASCVCLPVSRSLTLKLWFFAATYPPAVSCLFPPGDLYPLLGVCFPTSPAVAAHHCAKHALNKSSNIKTPQGTIVSLPRLPTTRLSSTIMVSPAFVCCALECFKWFCNMETCSVVHTANSRTCS